MLGRLVRLICSSSGRLRGNSAVWIPEKRTPKGPLPPRTENHLPQVWVTRAPAGQIKEGEEEHTSPTAEESCIRCCNILPQQRGLPQWRTPKGIAVWIPLFCFPPGSSDCNHFKVGGGCSPNQCLLPFPIGVAAGDFFPLRAVNCVLLPISICEAGRRRFAVF